MRRASLFALLLLLSGCLRRQAPVRAQVSTPVKVAIIHDKEGGGVLPVPEALWSQVERELGLRNLTVERADPALHASLHQVRDTARRARMLREATPAGLTLLVEARAVFFSHLSGRFRWVTSSRLTAGMGSEQVEADVEHPVFLDLDRQKEEVALATAAPTIAEHAGRLLDGVLQQPQSSASPPGALYFLLVDRFANGEPSNDQSVDLKDPAAWHGGDLAGVRSRLPDLAKLGVTTLWLSPVTSSRQEKFYEHGAFHGYWVKDLFAVEPRFGTEAELAALVKDAGGHGIRVLLDLVVNHVAFDAPLVSQHPDWFHQEGGLEDWTDSTQLVRRDVHGLPDLAQEKPEVFDHLLKAAKRWAGLGIAGFRLDAVKHVGNDFWRRFNHALRQDLPGFVLLGEVLDGDPRVVAKAQREGSFDSVFDFPLAFAALDVFCDGQPAFKLGGALSQDRLYPDPGALVTLLDNHDLPRAASRCRKDQARLKLALAFLLTARGTPSLTYGTESALEGEKEPANRADMRFDSQPLREDIARLLALRRAHPSLHLGVPALLSAEPDAFVYQRLAPGERGHLAFNLSDRPREFSPHGTVGPRSFAVAFERGDFAAEYAARQSQWRSGARKRRVELRVPAPTDGLFWVGSAPELGAWRLDQAVAVKEGRAQVDLPVDSVLEHKLVRREPGGRVQWESGLNRAAFISDGAAALELEAAWQ